MFSFSTNNSLLKTARLAGFLYLIMALAGPFSIIYVPSKLIVMDDAAATAKNILENEFLWRSSIACSIVSLCIFIFVAYTLYKLFKNTNENLSKLMFALVIVQIPVDLIIQVFDITTLMILKSKVLSGLETAQRQEIAMLFIKMSSYSTILLEVFWGLWLVPFGQLVYKSGFIPRFFGVYLILNAIAYVLVTIIFVLIPDYLNLVEKFTFPLLFGEIAITFWLLIKGVRIPKKIDDNNAKF